MVGGSSLDWPSRPQQRFVDVYGILNRYTFGKRPMRTNIEIDDALMKEAQKASGHATKKKTVEEALRLMVKLRRQADARKGFGKIPWCGDLAQSRRGRGVG